LSSRAKTKNLQEEFEQEIIEKSVTIDYTSKRVMVDLLFVRPPVEFLTKKHGRVDNFTQALRVYRSQCRKHEEVKVQLREAQKGLVNHGFMVP
jgi:hypothetical protein